MKHVYFQRENVIFGVVCVCVLCVRMKITHPVTYYLDIRSSHNHIHPAHLYYGVTYLVLLWILHISHMGDNSFDFVECTCAFYKHVAFCLDREESGSNMFRFLKMSSFFRTFKNSSSLEQLWQFICSHSSLHTPPRPSVTSLKTNLILHCLAMHTLHPIPWLLSWTIFTWPSARLGWN